MKTELTKEQSQHLINLGRKEGQLNYAKKKFRLFERSKEQIDT